MSNIKQHLMEKYEGFYRPYNETEKYVDIKFDNSNRIYTYIAPPNENIHKNEKYLIKSNFNEEEITIIKEPYTSPKKYDYNYKVLEIIKKINKSQFKMKEKLEKYYYINHTYIVKYNNIEHNEYLNCKTYIGGYTEDHLAKLLEDNPGDTYFMYDMFENRKIFLGFFSLIKSEENQNKVELAIALSTEYFPPGTILQEMYNFQAKFIHAIYKFLKKYYDIDMKNYIIILQNAGPYEIESAMLGILNASKIMQVRFKYGINYWEYIFKPENEINIQH